MLPSNQELWSSCLGKVRWVFVALLLLPVFGRSQDEQQPYRILVVPADQVDRFLEKKLQDPHRLLTIKEFEDLKKYLPMPRQKPRVIELASSSYHATWKETYLEGTANWSFGGMAQGPVSLPLDSFNLAIRKWKPSVAPVWVGEWEKGKLSLVAPQGGMESVEFDWSVRANQLPTGHSLQIQIPPAATGSFEITHGAEWLCVLTSMGIQETFPSKSMPGKKVTRILASGERQLDITMVSQPNLAAASGQWVAKILSRHRIQEFSCTSEYELIPGASLFFGKPLELETMPGLEITDVSSQAIQQWQFQPGQSGQNGKLVLSPSPRANINKTILIKGVQGPINQRDPWWRCPWVKPLNSPPCLEQTTVSVEHGLLVEDVVSGDFTGLPGGQASAMIQMNFQGGGLMQKAPGLRYPSIQFSIQPSRYRAHVYSNFTPEPASASMVSRIYLRQIHGAMQFFSLEIPGNFKIDNLFFDGNDNKVRDWSVVQKGNTQVLRIELDSPILSSHSTEETGVHDLPCVFLYLSSRSQSARFKDWPFPAIVPLQAASLEGYLGVSTNRNLQKIQVRTDHAASDPPGDIPIHMQGAQYLYHYLAIPPQGFVDLVPVKGLVKSSLHSHYHVSPNSLKMEWDFSIQAESGAAEFLDILVPAGMQPDLWSWKSPTRGQVVARVDRLATMEPTVVATMVGSMGSFWAGFSALGITENPAPWRVHFTKGFSGKETLQLQASWVVPFVGCPMQIPLVFLRDDPSPAQKVDVDLGLFFDAQLKLLNVDIEPGGGVYNKKFLAQSPLSSITLVKPDSRQPTPSGSILNCETIQFLVPGNSVVHQLQIDLQDWASGHFPITLPANAEWLGASIQGKPFSQAPVRVGEDFLVPISIEDRNSRLSIRYSIQADTRWLWKRIDHAEPRFLQIPLRQQTWWVIPPGWAPVGKSDWKSFSGPELFQQDAGWFPWRMRYTSPAADVSAKLQQLLQSRLTTRQNSNALALVEFLAQACRESQHPLFVDSFAIRGMPVDVAPGSFPVSEILRDGKLAMVPFGSGFILTSATQAKHLPQAVPQSFLDRIQATGMEPSGRLIAGWFFVSQYETFQPTRHDANGKYLGLVPLDHPGWMFNANGSGMFLFNPGRLQALGALLAFCLVLFFRLQNLQAGTGSWIFLLGALGAGMSLQPDLLIPLLWWSFVVVALESLRAFRTRWSPAGVLKNPAQEKTEVVNPLVTGVILAVWLVAEPAFQAAPITVTDVYFLAPNPMKPAPGTYLVPESLLKKELPEAGVAVIEKAAYRGKLLDDSLWFEFTLEVKSSGTANLDLSSQGIWFKDNLQLNGKSALGVSLPTGAFTIRIPGAGDHQVTGEFRIPIQDEFFRKAANFTLPSCVQSSLTCDLGPQAELVSISGTRGYHETVKSGNRSVLESDIGRTSQPVSIRWEKGPLRPRALPSVREAYFLEVSPGGAKLQSYWDLQTGDAGTDVFECLVPKSLVPEGFQVRTQSGEKLLVNQFEKKPGAGQDRLILQFNRRFRSDVQILGSFHCLEMPGPKWSVPIPTPVATFRDKSSYLAYQAKGCEVQRSEIPQRITGVDPKSFAPFWNTPEKPDITTLSYACLLGREPPGKPVMNLNVSLPRQTFEITQNLSATPLPHQLLMDFQVAIQNSGAKLPLLVWHLDSTYPMVLNRIQGDAIAHWQQSDRKVFLWLKNHPDKITLQAQAAFSTPFQKQGFSVKIPRSTWTGAARVETTATLAPLDGFVSTVNPSGGFEPQENGYKATRPDAALGLEFRPIPLSGKVESKLGLERRDTRDLLQLELRFTGLAPGASSYQLHLEDWPLEEPSWETSSQMVITRKTPKDKTRSFNILFPRQEKGTQVVRFQSPVQKVEGEDTPVVPDWSLRGAQSFSKVFQVAQSDLEAVGQKTKRKGPAPPEIVLNQVDVFPMGIARINMRSTWWLVSREDSFARVIIPRQYALQSAHLNQKQLESRQGLDGAQYLEIPMKPGFHVLVLSYVESGFRESPAPLFIPKVNDVSAPETLMRAYDGKAPGPGSLTLEKALAMQAKTIVSISDRFVEWKKEPKSPALGVFPLIGIMERLVKQLELLKPDSDSMAQVELLREKAREIAAMKDNSPEEPQQLQVAPFLTPSRIWILGKGDGAYYPKTMESAGSNRHAAWLMALLWVLMSYVLFLAWNRPWSAWALQFTWPEWFLVSAILTAFLPGLTLLGVTLFVIGIVSRTILVTRLILRRFYAVKSKPENVMEAGPA